MRKIMIRTVLAVTTLLLAILITYSFIMQSGASAKHIDGVETRTRAEDVILACTGRSEGLSDFTDIGAAIDGVIQTIHVKEGQLVKQGDVLAEIGCGDLQSALRVAKAEADSLNQSRVRLLRGSRDEERLVAAQKTAAARAVAGGGAPDPERTKKQRRHQQVSIGT